MLNLNLWRSTTAVTLIAMALAVSACQSPALIPSRGSTLTASASRTRQAGQVVTERLATTSLGVPKSYKVYLPPNYPNNGPYPVLYLMRGTMDEWLNPNQDGSRQGRTAVTLYEALRRQGQVGDLIMVFPGLGSDDGRWPGILTDWQHPELANGVGNGRFGTFFAKDLVPAVDRKFRTLGKGHRAVDGFSLGGWAAIQAATMMPGEFASAGAFDGTFPEADGPNRIKADDGLQEVDFFEPIFGKPWNQKAAVAASPANLILQGSGKQWQSINWLIEYCPEALEPRGNFYRGDWLVQALRAKGARNRFAGPVEATSHAWWHADEHLARALPWHWQAIKAAGTATAK